MLSGLLLAGALLLLLLATPRLMAHLALTSGTPGLERLRRGEVLTEAGFARVERSRRAALRWADLPRIHLDLGVLQLRRAVVLREEGRLAAARAALAEAIAAFERGLAREPVDPYAWHELAYAYLYAGEPRRAARALAMSYRTGRYIPALALSRARPALVLWELLPARWRPWAMRDLVRAWRQDRKTLEAFAEGVGLTARLHRLVEEASGGFAS